MSSKTKKPMTKATELLSTYRAGVSKAQAKFSLIEELEQQRAALEDDKTTDPDKLAVKMADLDREIEIARHARRLIIERTYDAVLPDLGEAIATERLQLQTERKKIEEQNANNIRAHVASDHIQTAARDIYALFRLFSRQLGLHDRPTMDQFFKAIGGNSIDISDAVTPEIQEYPEEKLLQQLKSVARQTESEMTERGLAVPHYGEEMPSLEKNAFNDLKPQSEHVDERPALS